MKEKLLELLAFMPFMLKIDSGDGNYSIKANLPEIIRTLVITIIVAACGAYITITKLEVNQSHIIESNKMLTGKFDKMCEKVGDLSEAMAVIKTRQDDRLERERAQGFRK